MITDVTAVLLAGGKSRRMGEDKRFLPVGDRTLFDRSCTALQQTFDSVCVVIAQDSAALEAGVPVVRDLINNCGSLGGLYTGLRHAKTNHVFLAACDMPFLNPRLIEYLVGLKGDRDIVICRWKNRLHPTHALYGQQCCAVIEEMLRTQQLKIQSLVTHSALRIRVVEECEIEKIDPAGRSFLNVNTPSDLASVREMRTETGGEAE